MEMGPQSYLLEEDEYLWAKELPVIVEVMLRLVEQILLKIPLNLFRLIKVNFLISTCP